MTTLHVECVRPTDSPNVHGSRALTAPSSGMSCLRSDFGLGPKNQFDQAGQHRSAPYTMISAGQVGQCAGIPISTVVRVRFAISVPMYTTIALDSALDFQ